LQNTTTDLQSNFQSLLPMEQGSWNPMIHRWCTVWGLEREL